MSGLTRKAIGARRPRLRATASTRASSASDSRLMQPNALFQRVADLGFGLADAGKQRLARFAARRQHPGELAAGHDVEAGAEAREQREDGEIRICLDRVADLRVAALERVREFAVRTLDRGGE